MSSPVIRNSDRENAYSIALWYSNKDATKSTKISKKAFNLCERFGVDITAELIQFYINQINSSLAEPRAPGPHFLKNGISSLELKLIKTYYERLRRDIINPMLYEYINETINPKAFILAALTNSDKQNIHRRGITMDPDPDDDMMNRLINQCKRTRVVFNNHHNHDAFVDDNDDNVCMDDMDSDSFIDDSTPKVYKKPKKSKKSKPVVIDLVSDEDDNDDIYDNDCEVQVSRPLKRTRAASPETLMSLVKSKESHGPFKYW